MSRETVNTNNELKSQTPQPQLSLFDIQLPKPTYIMKNVPETGRCLDHDAHAQIQIIQNFIPK